MKEKFDVTGMTCSACSSRVEKCVSKLDGMQDVSVNLLTNSMQVEFDQTKLSTQQIISAVTQAGYGAQRKRGAYRQRSCRHSTRTAPKSGGSPAKRNEASADYFLCIFDSADVCVHGAYGGPAAAVLFVGPSERSQLRLYPIFAGAACSVYQP